MRHSTYIALVSVAAVMSWTVAAHFILVNIGMLIQPDLPARVCPRADGETVACSIVIDNRDNLTLQNIAASLRGPIWRLVIDNPTEPIVWRIPPGTIIDVTRTHPAPVDPW
jgi:hypothetical protein